MDDSDNKEGRGGNSGGDKSDPSADFGRRRVAGVLRRERPRHDQADTMLRLGDETARLTRLFLEKKVSCKLWMLGTRWVKGYNFTKGHTAQLDVDFHCFKGARARKKTAVNFNSRFVRPNFS